MIIQPKCRGFICTTAHPVGCTQNVRAQIDYVKQQGKTNGPKRILVVGASTGYGLACRIAGAYGMDAATIGVYFDKPATEKKTGTAGWYNNRAFERFAHQDGLYAKSINADAFSDEVKQQVIEMIKADMQGGQIDLMVYSLASPKRTNPRNGITYTSAIKPIGQPFTGKTVDFHTGVVSQAEIEPATEDQINSTVAVMGGEDWLFWIEMMREAGVLADGFTTTAFSYIGPELTHPLYADGTIGRAKKDLEQKAEDIRQLLAPMHGRAYVSVNKALVTQASVAIPVVSLYVSILYKIMKEQGTHEGCIEQAYRLLKERLYTGGDAPVDKEGRIRLDDWEMADSVQQSIPAIWDKITTETVEELSDIAGYRREFFQLFGFERDDVDYTMDVEPL